MNTVCAVQMKKNFDLAASMRKMDKKRTNKTFCFGEFYFDRGLQTPLKFCSSPLLPNNSEIICFKLCFNIKFIINLQLQTSDQKQLNRKQLVIQS